MKFELTKEDVSQIELIRNRVEDNSIQLDIIVNQIISPYLNDLDKYVMFIRDCLKDGEKPPTTSELEDFCMNLSSLIYFASGICENLGVRDDISKAIYKETYNEIRSNLDKGTIADKDSIAELQSREEQIISICYTRSYKIMKAKVDAAQEMLSSCKKCLSHRMQEEQLVHINMSNNNDY